VKPASFPAVVGTVEAWHDEQGWGVLRTPDGLSVFCHFSHIEMDGYAALTAGASVWFDYAIPGQDGGPHLHARLTTTITQADGTSVTEIHES
jgi:CspA family cold shock protein